MSWGVDQSSLFKWFIHYNFMNINGKTLFLSKWERTKGNLGKQHQFRTTKVWFGLELMWPKPEVALSICHFIFIFDRLHSSYALHLRPLKEINCINLYLICIRIFRAGKIFSSAWLGLWPFSIQLEIQLSTGLSYKDNKRKIFKW